MRSRGSIPRNVFSHVQGRRFFKAARSEARAAVRLSASDGILCAIAVTASMRPGKSCRRSSNFVVKLRPDSVALVHRYVGDLYYEKKRQTNIPHFLREGAGADHFF